jgi:tetratricopeptide (TPR) repeat protein
MNRRDRRAALPQTKSPSSSATTPDALYEAGLRHLRAERYLDAQICCRQALAIASGHAGTLHLMGLLSLQAKQFDHAVEWLAGAIRQDPKPEYLLSLGTALRHLGRREEALKAIDKAVQLKPEDPDLWKSLGDVLVELERPADALLSFQHALKLNARHWNAANECGVLLYQLGRLEEALVYFRVCVELQPNHALTLAMSTRCMLDLGRFEEALDDNERAHASNPGNADICNNIGVALQSLQREEEALPWFDRAVHLRPDYVAALGNKAASLCRIRRFEEAKATYCRLKALDPDNATADVGLGHLHLLTGNFEASWVGHESRFAIASAPYPQFSQPKWVGNEAIKGKTILIRVDEGLGDSIQFARYVPMIAAQGARVILVVDDPAYPLLSGLPGVSQCFPISATGTLPEFDLHCPLSSLPLAFKTRLDSIPSGVSYLPNPAEAYVQAWEDRLGRHDKLRVGLTWSGNPKHKNDRNRSIPLRSFLHLLDVDATFVSLQKNPRPNDKLVLLERTGIIDLTTHLTDFAETAALVSRLDVVITVDTSVAHLSGALGCSTWILLPYVPDYRWLLDRDDSPWYPTVRLFRQTETREYESVLDGVRAELMGLVSAFESEKNERKLASNIGLAEVHESENGT